MDASVDVPSGTVTFLFTDIEGSSRLWDQYPDEMRVALEQHDTVLRAAFDSGFGHVFATGGDGFCVAFRRARDAVHTSWNAQQALDRVDWPPHTPLRVRMGVHTGESTERDGDYFGSPVNMAARLMGLAHGGQIVLSAATAALVDGAVPAGSRLIHAGTHRLRGFEREERVVVLTGADTATADLRLSRSPGNLPSPLTSFVGRSMDVKRLAADLPRRRAVDRPSAELERPCARPPPHSDDPEERARRESPEVGRVRLSIDPVDTEWSGCHASQGSALESDGQHRARMRAPRIGSKCLLLRLMTEIATTP